MSKFKCIKLLFVLSGCLVAFVANAKPVIYINQVAFNSDAPKIALVGDNEIYTYNPSFSLISETTHKIVFTGKLGHDMQITEWAPGKHFYKADFSAFTQAGKYRLSVTLSGKIYTSDIFNIGVNELAKLTIPSVIHYYHKQRANTPAELAADSKNETFWQR